MPGPDLEALLARFIEEHVRVGRGPSPEELCEGRAELVVPLRALIDAYLALSGSLEPAGGPAPPRAAVFSPALPVIEGFHTIERLGQGGMGEVYKLRDLKLDRVVAGKIVRRDRGAAIALRRFLAEARTLALFTDPRIVQIHELRDEGDPAVIVMEYVDGFELGQVAPSLEYRQRARIVEQVAEAIDHAHQLGIQHRDLKPSNIMLDAALTPKILDFGLSAGEPNRGHLAGTVPYLAPEQLDPALPIDARTDVYALGVILYEALCGERPFGGTVEAEVMAAIKTGQPRLPLEVEPSVPEPLQAIALKAMESDPAARYRTAREMAQDLRRYLEGRPVEARPRAYVSALQSRVKPHLDHIAEWLRLRLIYPHEAGRLEAAYRDLEAREDDWILSSRTLSYAQVTLYLGAFFLLAGALFYFHAYVQAVVAGIVKPFLVLGLPLLGLNAIAHYLYRRENRIVAVAFYLGGVALLPLLVMILLRENQVLAVGPGATDQLFEDGYLSNRQVQITMLLSSGWALVLALRTRTAALSTVFTVLLFLLALAFLGDFGLRGWVEGGEYHRIAWHLMPLVGVYAAFGYACERSKLPWLGRTLYVAAALAFVLVLELMAQNGKAFAYLGLDMQMFLLEGTEVTDLGNTLMAMAANGVLMYLVALALERRGSDVMRRASGLLFTLSPFAALKPLGYLSMTGSYTPNIDWLYLALSVGSCLISQHRQRRSFYVAGLMNAGGALYVIADHNGWMDKPAWAVLLVAAGLLTLACGYLLNVAERRGRQARGH